MNNQRIARELVKLAKTLVAGCEKLPEGPMRDNCEKKKEEGKKSKESSGREAAGKEIVFDGKNAKDVEKFLAKHGYKLNIESNGKLTVGDKESIIFKGDTLLVKGGKLHIKKPSYGGGRETVVARELVRLARVLVSASTEITYDGGTLVFEDGTTMKAPKMIKDELGSGSSSFTYERGKLTFEDGSTMKAPHEVKKVLARELVSSDLLDLEQIRDFLKRKYGSNEVKIKGNDLSLSIIISRTTISGYTINVSYRLYAARGGEAFVLDGYETVDKDGDVVEHDKMKVRVKSDDPDSYIPKMSERRLKKFSANRIESWLDTDWD